MKLCHQSVCNCTNCSHSSFIYQGCRTFWVLHKRNLQVVLHPLSPKYTWTAAKTGKLGLPMQHLWAVLCQNRIVHDITSLEGLQACCVYVTLAVLLHACHAVTRVRTYMMGFWCISYTFIEAWASHDVVSRTSVPVAQTLHRQISVLDHAMNPTSSQTHAKHQMSVESAWPRVMCA